MATRPTPLLQLQVTFAVLLELTLSPGMLRYRPFTPSWRVALRSIGAWPRSAGVVWLADCYLRSANHPRTARPESKFAE